MASADGTIDVGDPRRRSEMSMTDDDRGYSSQAGSVIPFIILAAKCTTSSIVLKEHGHVLVFAEPLRL